MTIGADGTPQLTAGQWDVPMFPRSSNKPMQAAGMLRCGLDLEGKLLALAAASHSGEDFHVAGVRARSWPGPGLPRTTCSARGRCPGKKCSKQEYLREGTGPGAHELLRQARGHARHLRGGPRPTATYTDPAHPLQVALRRASRRPGREQSAAVGVDRWGAPVFALSLAGLARAFPGAGHRLAGHAGAPGGRRDAGLSGVDVGEPAHGTGADGHCPGPAAEGGGGARSGGRLADGRAVAFKIEDGSARARDPVTVALLRRLGVTTRPGVPDSALDEIGAVPVLGGGRVVGVIRAELPG